MNKLAPIVLFVYNRPNHALRLLESLAKCKLSDQSELFIFADGPEDDAPETDIEKIKEVRSLIRSRQWCMKVHIHESENNLGLADSIIHGVTQIIQQFGKIIVIEDDLILSPGFLEYLNEALKIYDEDERVMHISAYMYPIKKNLPATFFLNTTSCWGWATWSRAWKYFNPSAEELLKQLNQSGRLNEYTFESSAPFYDHLQWNVNGQLKTWAIKWYTSVFLQNGFCLHPFPSLVRNSGNDGSGTHGSVPVFNNQEIVNSIIPKKIPVEENMIARKEIKKFYRDNTYPKNIFKRILKRVFSPST